MTSPRSKTTPLTVALAVCVIAGLVSVLAPFQPVYDAWSWLVWGRELGGLDLDTSAGPSWKPLPVLVTAPLAPLGDVAPDLWLAIARAGWLAAAVLAWRLAARLEGSHGARAVAAGAIAAAGTLLLADEVTAWTRQAAGGLSEPLLVALVLGAVDAGLSGRSRVALALALVACLLRPEVWPFAALYGVLEARAGRVAVPAVAAGTGLVAVLWFVPDLAGAGNALEGADRARGADSSPLETLRWALVMPLTALWAGVLLAVARWTEGTWSQARTLALGAGLWIALVAVMAGLGYAGLPRFMAPAIVILGAVGAAGLVWGIGALDRGRIAVAALVGAALAIQGGIRAGGIPGALDHARDDSERFEELAELADSDPVSFTGCGELWTSEFLTQPQLAWRLDLALSEVQPTRTALPRDGRIVTGFETEPGLVARLRESGPPLATSGEWAVFGTGACR